MAKKRKASARSQESTGPAELDPRDSKKRISTYEDVADSGDEFHLNQDEIRLGEEPEAKRRRKWAEQEEFLEQSDEEVLGYPDDEEASDDGEPAKPRGKRNQVDYNGEEEDEEQEIDDEDAQLGWGTSKTDLYGADEIETEEQALEEEAEALRLQRKQLESMQAADYGFDEDEWQKPGDNEETRDEDEGATVTEVLPQLQIAPDLSPAERLKLLKSRYPEFELLSKELLEIRERQSELANATSGSSSTLAKLRAASAYIGALAMYFAIFTSTAAQGESGVTAMSATQLRDHPVWDSLMKCRATWAKLDQLPDDEDLESDEDEELDDMEEEDELDQKDAVLDVPSRKLSRAERHAQAVQAAAEQRRAERLKRTEADLADLDALIAPSKTGSKVAKAQRNNGNDDESDLGEEAGLTAREAADKAKKKKSLRFYTSQIAQKANKRGAAGRNAGGDDDIPFRERLRDRQARLNAEAEKRGKRPADISAELGGDSDEDDDRQAREIRADADDDDYYDMIAARTARKKQDKSALAEAQRQAALQGGQLVQEESVGVDGKRKISYAIEKNKGLTPHRKKDVRNPRVKKRKKYDEKKKKLASIKPVYKGGEGRGGYGGELTGIKKGLVKSTKL